MTTYKVVVKLNGFLTELEKLNRESKCCCNVLSSKDGISAEVEMFYFRKI